MSDTVEAKASLPPPAGVDYDALNDGAMALGRREEEPPTEDAAGSVPLTWLERHAPTKKIPEALLSSSRPSERKGSCDEGRPTRFAFCGGGIVRDYQGRFGTYQMIVSDWVDGISWKTKSAALFMFCATATSTIALGDVAFRETNGMVGITEYLMLQGVAGVFHALFSCCPLPILRPTGPITAFMVDLYDLANSVEVDYYSLLAWVGLWVGIGLSLIAVMGWSKYIALCTRFLHDIYAVFVCTIYITDGILGAIQRFDKVEWSQAFFAAMIAILCIVFSLGFYYIDRSVLFNLRWRQTISDYAVPLSVVICIFISYSVNDHVEVDRIEMPRNFEPTYTDETGERRAWYQGIMGNGNNDTHDTMVTAGISAIAAIPIIALFYIDHLFSCILGQKQELGLRKGEYYHSSMLITGICNFVLPSFGLPFVTASLPHSPQFTKALTDYDKSTTPWTPTYVHESRIAPIMVYILCFFGLVFPSILELCPEGVVNGILTFVGLQGILPWTGNQFIDRCVLLLTDPSEFSITEVPPSHEVGAMTTAPYLHLSWKRIHLYTLVQLGCLAACWGMRFTGPFALAFPLVIVGFVPLRLYVLPMIFSEEELDALDAEGGGGGSGSGSGSEAQIAAAHESGSRNQAAPISAEHYVELT